jgi:hypothetical protein
MFVIPIITSYVLQWEALSFCCCVVIRPFIHELMFTEEKENEEEHNENFHNTYKKNISRKWVLQKARALRSIIYASIILPFQLNILSKNIF